MLLNKILSPNKETINPILPLSDDKNCFWEPVAIAGSLKIVSPDKLSSLAFLFTS